MPCPRQAEQVPFCSVSAPGGMLGTRAEIPQCLHLESSGSSPWPRSKHRGCDGNARGLVTPAKGAPSHRNHSQRRSRGSTEAGSWLPRDPKITAAAEKPLHLPQVRSTAPTRGRGRQVGCAARLCVWLEPRCLPRDPPQHQALLSYGPALKKLK